MLMEQIEPQLVWPPITVRGSRAGRVIERTLRFSCHDSSLDLPSLSLASTDHQLEFAVIAECGACLTLRRRVDRELQKCACAAPLARHQFHVPAMFLGDRVGDGQPESGAGADRFGGEERFEYSIADGWRDAAAGVLDQQLKPALAFTAADRDRTRSDDRVDGVADQVYDRLIQQARVAVDSVRLAELCDDRQARSHAVLQDGERRLHALAHADAFAFALVEARKGAQLE